MISFDVQGHRGARGLLPENTIPAFIQALQLGVTTLEMDAVISQDQQVVISHEPWFNHEICTTPDGTRIAEEEARSHNMFALTYEEIKQYDCGQIKNPRFPRQQTQPAYKPLLREVIQSAEAYTRRHGLPPVHYNIETKSTPQGDNLFHPTPDVFTRLVLDVIVEEGIADRAILQSFDVRTLQEAQSLAYDGIKLAYLVSYAGDAGLDGNLDLLGFLPDIYSPNFRLVNTEMVQEAHDRGISVIPWTINDLEEMRRQKMLGVDGIITDYPDLGVKLLPPR